MIQKYTLYRDNIIIGNYHIQSNDNQIICGIKLKRKDIIFQVKYNKVAKKYEIQFDDATYEYGYDIGNESSGLREGAVLGGTELFPLYIQRLIEEDALGVESHVVKNPFSDNTQNTKITKIGNYFIDEVGYCQLFFFNSKVKGTNVLLNSKNEFIYSIDPYLGEEIISSDYCLKSIKGSLKKSLDTQLPNMALEMFFGNNDEVALVKPAYIRAKIPLVILISGSGNLDKNGNCGDLMFNTLNQLAYGLAKNGIASIRYDDGAKDGEHWLDESINEVEKAIENIGNQEFLDWNNIYVIGHSQGGVIAMNIAFRKSYIKGLILLNSPGKEYEYLYREQMNLFDFDDQDMLIEFLAFLKDKEVKSDIKSNKYYIKNYKEINRMRSLMNIEMVKLQRCIHQKTLIIHGEQDFQVDKSHAKCIFNNIKNGGASLKLLPDVNHFLTTSQMGGIGDYSRYGTELSEKVLYEITAFINNKSC